MDCYACDQAATHRCPRCGQPYCPDHGQSALGGCARCLHPGSIAPSSGLFRASLLALLIGSALALWLLIRPPGLPGEPGPVVGPQPTATATPTTTTTPTATPSPTATPAPTFQVYVVQDNDTLLDIADRFGVTVDDIVAANGLSGPEEIINVGQELKIPLPTPTPTPTPPSEPQ